LKQHKDTHEEEQKAIIVDVNNNKSCPKWCIKML